MIPSSSIRVKNARANGADVLRARTKSQSMLPQRAGELEHAREVGLLLGEREQLRRDHVAERGDEHRLGDHVQLARALEVAVVDRAAGRMEDQVDERLAVPGLDQPTLRGTLRPRPCGDERVERARHVAPARRDRHRVVLLHYAPITDTLVGEPETIWAFPGSPRLATPIGAHRPDDVLHGHAHRGSFAGRLGPVRVRNVTVAVTGRDGKDFEL